MKKWIMLVVLCIIGNLVHASVTIEKGDDVSWVIDSNVTYNGLGTLKTGSITDGESTSVVLTFTDTDFIELFVKTSTEAGCDKLIIECNDEIYEYSGESMWESVPLQLENEQTVTLTYLKDGSVSNGQDCCWVWFEGADSLLFDDINNSDEEYKQKVFAVISGDFAGNVNPLQFFKEILPPRNRDKNFLEDVETDGIDVKKFELTICAMKGIQADKVYGKQALSKFIECMEYINVFLN